MKSDYRTCILVMLGNEPLELRV